MATDEKMEEMLTLEERIKLWGVNEALEKALFGENSKNKEYIKDFLGRYKGDNPYIGMAAENLSTGLQNYLLRTGVDYKKFDTIMLELKAQYEKDKLEGKDIVQEESQDEPQAESESEHPTIGIDTSYGSSISYTADAIAIGTSTVTTRADGFVARW